MNIESFNRAKFNRYIRPLFIKDKCEECGSKKKLELHHADKQFIEILDESLKMLNLNYKESIDSYSRNELEKLENVMLGMQLKIKYKTLCKECHNREHTKRLVKINKVSKPKNNYEIIKISKRRNDTTSILDSSHNMTTMESRILYMALKQCKETDNYKAFVRVEDFKNTFKSSSNSIYKNIEEISQNLNRLSMKYINNNKIFKDYFIDKSKYIDCGVYIEFNTKMINDLIHDKLPYMDELLNSSKFSIKKKHSFRLYELLKPYLKQGYKEFDVEDLKFKLAVKNDEYKLYKDFKTSVILSTIEELNEKSDLLISYHELERKKRAVSKIIFKIKQKQ
ncbi:hypothetical protein AM596_15760 [Clostridium perfringens CP4]|uniref:replication initiation protein n=1 Tax=Clostridium perfringens TaxID=1502 RepID=UPI00070780C6|nr:replication initiation protein [Clostridium perfringens]KQC91228.1 hypothetical protein AM596_15760 [Clostridium perfringens CP4]